MNVCLNEYRLFICLLKTSAKTRRLKKQIQYPVNNVAMKLTHSISKHTVNSMYQAVCKLI